MLNKNNSTDVHIKDRMNSAIKSVNKELQKTSQKTRYDTIRCKSQHKSEVCVS